MNDSQVDPISIIDLRIIFTSNDVHLLFVIINFRLHISDVSHHNLRIFLNISFFLSKRKIIFFIMKISLSKPSVWNWIILNWLLQKMMSFHAFFYLHIFLTQKFPVFFAWEKWEARICRNVKWRHPRSGHIWLLKELQYLLSSLKEFLHIHVNVRRIEFWLWQNYIPQSKSNNKYTK